MIKRIISLSDLFRKIYTYKEEIMATTCEERMDIYKELVKDCTAPPDGKGGAEEILKEDKKAVSFVLANVSSCVYR